MKNYYFKKQRLAVVIAGGLMSLLVAFSLTPTFAGLVAQIKNTVNSTKTGSIVLEESSGGVTCVSTDGTGNVYECETINKYGGEDSPLAPGGAGNTTTITLKNTGSLDATKIAVIADACLQDGTTAPGAPNSICDVVDITITAGGVQVFPTTANPTAVTARDFATAAASPNGIDFSTASGVLDALNSDSGVNITINAKLKSTAGVAYQGLKISQIITWLIES